MTSPSDPCPGCGATASREVGSRGSLRLVRCGRCTLVFSSPPPIDAVLDKYVNEYDLAAHFGEWAPRKRLLYERRLRGLAAPSADRRRLCDVGCGDGQFLAIARAAGWEPFGIELNPPAARRARELGAHVYEGLLERIDDLPWHSFDLVTSWDVLEHTPTPREFVRRLRRLVTPGGTVLLTTLNVRSLAFWVFGLDWSMVVDDHFTYWNRRSLIALVESEGFEVAGSSTFGLGRDFVAVLDRRRHGRSNAGGGGADARRWDVHRAVVAAETAANAVLRLTGTGVGLSVTLRPI